MGNPGRSFGVVAKLSPPAFDPPDTILDGADAGGLTIRAASVRGLSHRYYRTPRQDDYAVALDRSEKYLIAIVADGVGAGKLSHRAALIVTQEGAEVLADELTRVEFQDLDWARILQHLADRIVKDAHWWIAQEGRRNGAPQSATAPSMAEVSAIMASTALFVILPVEPDAGGNRQAVVVWLGDTSAWVLRDGTWLAQQPIKNEGAEIATNAVAALPLYPNEFLCHQISVGPNDVLVLMSDGVGDPLGNGEGEVGQFLASVWARPPRPLDFAAQVGFGRKSFDDDRTAVAIWPSQER